LAVREGTEENGMSIDYREARMKRYAEAIGWGVCIVLGGCIAFYVIWPWIRSW
jgi:hypothetical protein